LPPPAPVPASVLAEPFEHPSASTTITIEQRLASMRKRYHALHRAFA
jgi:hypothetical protein